MDDSRQSPAGTHLGFSVSVADAAAGGINVTILGELDMASAPALRDALERALDHEGEVELDMRACSFVDSTGIATIVTAARRLHDQGRTLRVRGASHRVRRIFELAGLLSQRWITIDPADDVPPG